MAQREAARDEIIRRCGKVSCRRFRHFLWGSAYGLLNRGMENYRVLVERPQEILTSASIDGRLGMLSPEGFLRDQERSAPDSSRRASRCCS